MRSGFAKSSIRPRRSQANGQTVAGVPVLNEIVPHTDYVAECQHAVSSRRSWSIPLAVVGVLVAAGSLVVPRGRTVS